MKAYFCINEHGLTTLGERYLEHLVVAIYSCIHNTDLEPCLLYDGSSHDILRVVEELGCTILRHQLSFKDELGAACKEAQVNFDVASGAFLRLDIPLLNQEDELSLYVDVDVMFLRQPDFSGCHPMYFAAAPESDVENYSHINSGVMLINNHGLRAELPGLIENIIRGRLRALSGDPYHQGHLNDYFRDKIDRLSPVFNWKPYWGCNSEASIVHWHGVKYPEAKEISEGREREITSYHPHPEIYDRNPQGYSYYISKFEGLLEASSLMASKYKLNHNEESTPKVTVVVGPSHVILWKWHVRDGVVSSDLKHEQFIGLGGAPIWSKYLFESARNAIKNGGTVGVMVGDFRFGNAIARASDYEAYLLFQDSYLGIHPSAMTRENDLFMRERGLAAIKYWHKAFGENARLILWDLFGRQVFDRLSGRHICDRRYLHPVFNYCETVAWLPSAEIVDMAPLLRWPMHEIRRLFIDRSCHPSQIGYIFLNKALCRGQDVITAYREATSEVESALLALARQVSVAKGSPVLITGRSVWLDTIVGYLGEFGMARLAEAGLVLAPLAHVAGQPTIFQIMQEVPLDQCTPVVLSAGGHDISPNLARAFCTSLAFWHDLPVVDWEEGTKEAITARGETPRYSYVKASKAPVSEVFVPVLATHMVEQGPAGMPSWAGIVYMLEQIAAGAVPARQLAAASDSRLPTTKALMEDVLLTDEGNAFLTGDNHSVLKYATGELKPSQRSVEAFRSNIAARRRVSHSLRAPYVHVIFPDKQSVLSDSFPYQPVHRLGELYTYSLPASLRPSVIYPADALRQVAEPSSFTPLDTHLSDHGSLEVMRLILDELGIDAAATLDHIKSRISRIQRWSGDLGNKFSPPLLQEAKVLDADWPVIELRSPGGFNDGMIDILLNPAAANDATLLIFGDSFFRMMLKHLSAVFSKIIHLRSLFMHPEMAALIAPDYMLTGNAERYLSDVKPDTEAHSFSLYPYLRTEAPAPPGADFLAAWRAMTAPKSEFAAAYFLSKGFGMRPVQSAISGDVPLARARQGAVIENCYKKAPVLSIRHNTYFPVYEYLFEHFIDRNVTIVEIGVLNGGSLFMWRDYFGSSARIIGIDLNPEAKWLEKEGFEIYIGSQADPKFWEELFAKLGPVDIIIDDGGHTFSQQIVTAANVLQHVRDGGMLVVEDTHSSYMAEFGGPSPVSFISYAKSIVDGINYRYSQFVTDRPSERAVWSLQFFESIVAFIVNRSLAHVSSAPTSNNMPSLDTRDFRHSDMAVLSDADLSALFKYSS
ncbi:class I SAM-dependent methyltransferase [Aphanothece microscopica]|uniref:class I SAM-dependent methyltransferase n=1 Tax=Aphanothece microscopica TaxID=1049561 RepID=UPI0039849D7D